MSYNRNNLIFSFSIISFFWAMCIYVIFITYMQYNPVSTSKSFKMNLSLFVVQGWAFFTRNAREPNLYIYKKNNSGKLEIIPTQKNNSFDNYFGLSREARSLSVEVGYILKNIDTTSWVLSNKSIIEKYKFIKCIETENNAIHPQLKDTILLELKEKTPWAWIKSYEKIKLPNKTLKLYVRIPEKNKFQD